MGSWAEAELSSRFKVWHEQDQHDQRPHQNWANWALLGSDTIAIRQFRQFLLLTPRLRAPTASPTRHAGDNSTQSIDTYLPTSAR